MDDHRGACGTRQAVALALPALYPQIEQSRVIGAYCSTIDHAAIGQPVSVIISIKLERQRAAKLDRCAPAIAA